MQNIVFSKFRKSILFHGWVRWYKKAIFTSVYISPLFPIMFLPSVLFRVVCEVFGEGIQSSAPDNAAAGRADGSRDKTKTETWTRERGTRCSPCSVQPVHCPTTCSYARPGGRALISPRLSPAHLQLVVTCPTCGCPSSNPWGCPYPSPAYSKHSNVKQCDIKRRARQQMTPTVLSHE